MSIKIRRFVLFLFVGLSSSFPSFLQLLSFLPFPFRPFFLFLYCSPCSFSIYANRAIWKHRNLLSALFPPFSPYQAWGYLLTAGARCTSALNYGFRGPLKHCFICLPSILLRQAGIGSHFPNNETEAQEFTRWLVQSFMTDRWLDVLTDLKTHVHSSNWCFCLNVLQTARTSHAELKLSSYSVPFSSFFCSSFCHSANPTEWHSWLSPFLSLFSHI